MRGKSRQEFRYPQREAAIFFGLFLRGHPVELLREQIDISPKVFKKMMRLPEYDADFREHLRQNYVYRKQVLGIFDTLVTNAQSRTVAQ